MEQFREEEIELSFALRLIFIKLKGKPSEITKNKLIAEKATLLLNLNFIYDFHP